MATDLCSAQGRATTSHVFSWENRDDDCAISSTDGRVAHPHGHLTRRKRKTVGRGGGWGRLPQRVEPRTQSTAPTGQRRRSDEASKCCLIKGYSPQVDMAAICALCTRCEIAQKCILYFERVASPSNIGDGPSRFVRPPPLPSWGSALRSRLDALEQPPPATAASSFSARHVYMGMRDAPVC